MTILCSFDVIQ